MSAYDCGSSDCDECQRQFGPDRSKAIANHAARDAAYSGMERIYAAEPDTVSTAERNAATLAIIGGAA